MILRHIVQSLSAKLSCSFVENPKSEAKIIASHILNISTKDYLLRYDEECTDSDYQKMLSLVQKRLTGASIDVIIGSKEFYGESFLVTQDVLSPRPETEMIIDIFSDLSKNKPVMNILDIGTGSGVITAIIAKLYSSAEITALDVSSAALKVAMHNIQRIAIDLERIHFINADFLTYHTDTKFDFIISNPPYITTQETERLLNTKALSDPKISLDGGDDGLVFYRAIKEFALAHLNDGGYVIVEHGFDQQADIMQIFNEQEFYITPYNDLADLNRIIVAKIIKKN